MDPFTWTLTCPAVPVLAEGRTAEGAPFYFRARHGSWTLYVGDLDWPESCWDWPGDGRLVAEGSDPDGGAPRKPPATSSEECSVADALAYAHLTRASRVDWGQPVGDQPVDRYFGVISTPGPLCGGIDDMGEQACGHTSCGAILWPVRYVTGMPRG